MNAIGRFRCGGAVVLGIVSLLSGSTAFAADYTWKGTGNIWSDATNWMPEGGPPMVAGDTATIGGAPPNNLTIDVDVNLDKFTLDSPTKFVEAANRTVSATNGFDLKAGRLVIRSSTLTTTKSLSISGDAFLIATGSSTITSSGLVRNFGTVGVTSTAADGSQLSLSAGLFNSKTIEMVCNVAGKETVLTLKAGEETLANEGTMKFGGSDGSIRVQGVLINGQIRPDGLIGKIEVNRATTFQGKEDAVHDNLLGKITLENGAELTFTGKSLRNSGTIDGRGILNARSLTAVDPKGVINTGFFRPGRSAGILTIDGDLTQVDPGSLEIELGGTSIDLLSEDTDYDRLVITGTTALGGELHVSLIDHFLSQHPDPSDTFDVLTSDGGLTGLFSNASSYVFTTDGIGRFDVTYITGTGSPGDPGIVRLSNFEAVPEPGTGLLVVLASSLVTMLPLRRKRSA